MEFTKEQKRAISEAVQDYRDGCPEGRSQFLREGLGINPSPKRVKNTFEVTVEYDLSDYGSLETSRLSSVQFQTWMERGIKATNGNKRWFDNRHVTITVTGDGETQEA